MRNEKQKRRGVPRLYKFISLENPLRIDYTDNYEFCIVNYEFICNFVICIL